MDEGYAIVRRRRGYWLRLARERTGMTQDAVAHELGLRTGTSLVHWERGDRDPSVAQLSALADLYGLPVDVLLKPPQTDEERLEQLARGGTALALADVAAAEAEAHDAGTPPGPPPGTRRP